MLSFSGFLKALNEVGRKPNPNQQLAVEAAKDAPLFVVAGPGTGKTATLTMRMLKLVFVDQVEPKGILATTFTKKAAAELRSRVLGWGYGVQEWLLEHGGLSRMDRMWVERVDINQIRTGTIDSICEELLRDFRDPGTDPPILADEFVAETLMLRHGMFGASGQRRYQDPDLDEFLCSARGTGRYGWHVGSKTELVRTMWDRRHHDQLDWMAWVKSGSTKEEVAARKVLDEALDDYAVELSKRLMVDFSQLEQTVLDRLRAGGFKEFTDELQVVLVDEYQDTNLLQESLYFELAKRCDGALTVVGDDDQSLYRFRGATVDLFSNFASRYQSVGGFAKVPTPVFLNANYRSTSTIIGFVNDYARLDREYQAVRVAGKPKLKNPKAGEEEDFPILGMFRRTLDELAEDLASFIHKVTRGGGYKLPDGKVIQVDRKNGGDVGDLALLCSSPREVNAAGDSRLPMVLKDELLAQKEPIPTFNPRGQDFASIGIVQLLGGLLLCCLDRDGDAEDAAGKGLGRETRSTFGQWATLAEDWLKGTAVVPRVATKADTRLNHYVSHWADRKPDKSGAKWPTYVSCIELLYDLVHWLPELHDDPEGQVYLEVFARQLGAAEQVSGFKAQVITNPADAKLSKTSVGHLLLYFLAPIAEGSAKVDEELMDAFPRDRLSILSIHQSKGLEFPLVIVDVGSDFKASSKFPKGHFANAFKRFPRQPGTPHNLEDLMRPHSPLKTLKRDPIDRAFDDLFRQFFVAFSRPEEVLLLVGLDGSHPDRGTIRNVATGWDRDEQNHWAGKVPFFDI
ncbi:DEAD/DEAH box helicase [Luteolibacter flavescens]|uniref:DNA 3'-5' helicase II n=1 Tax=Luteolibacter flavescens TaxID=1859460 RepID=A0ABT3FT17_9BACT|nr:DEAD/DEAH box helicase [Luteolibacter flavescens]MCW1886723.1 DEAD/DEAH box helicase [Luteolibacter flavescens]